MGDDAASQVNSGASRVDFAGINALSSRPAGYAVALKCLQVQADAEQLDPSLRNNKRVRLHPDAWSWYQGALGEMQVGTILNALGPEWFVRHSVPIGADTKDVDHLVIGPGGVFAINTKHHAGASVWVGDQRLRVNNRNTSHLIIARSDAADVARRLAAKVEFAVPVTPVIAILNARSLKHGQTSPSRNVAVVDARGLLSWLQSQPAQLTVAKRELLKLAAEEPGTWHVDPRAADTYRVMQRFERLVSRVGATPRDGTRTAATTGKPHTSRKPTRRAASFRFTVADAVRMWVAAALVVGAILVFRAIANQPCASPTGCVLPAMYVAWKPLLVLASLAMVGRAAFVTLRGLVRRAAKSGS